MIRQTEIERYLDDWLGNSPMAPADRVVVSVAVRITRQKQRPAPRIAWALSDMLGSTRLLAGFATVLVVAIVGLGVAGYRPEILSGPPTSAPTTVPTAAPTATPAASRTEPPPTIGVSVEGGIPPSWTVTASGLLSFSAGPEGHSMFIEIMANRRIGAANCDMGPEAGIGTTADAFVRAIADRRGLVASNERAAEVGGQAGRSVDVHVDPSVGPTCGTADEGYVPLFGYSDNGLWNHFGVGPKEHVRVIALDVPGDQNVVIGIVGSDAAAFDRYIDDATTIVSHLSFDFG
jgi:hypothetical protein